jgi:uncharacterized protein YndB with AHSA1/START domain
MKTIHHVVDIGVEPADVYRAVATATGLRGWWSTVVTATSDTRGGRVDFTFDGDFNPVMEITEARPETLIVWRCVGGHEPWANNTFRFAIADHDNGSRLRFWQEYATELDDDRYGTYNFNWGYYLESLRVYCETGTGHPFAPALSGTAS